VNTNQRIKKRERKFAPSVIVVYWRENEKRKKKRK
jgi:hypothetical protein